MAGKIRYLHEDKNGYFARKRVPTDIRGQIGKEFFMKALGDGKREAERRLPSAIAEFEKEIERARASLPTDLASEDRDGGDDTPTRPLSPDQMAAKHYADQVEFDQELRNTTHLYARHGFIDEFYVETLREIRSGAATNDEIQNAIGWIFRKFQNLGHLDCTLGSTEWRYTASRLAAAEYEALNLAALRDDGEDAPTPPEWITNALSELENPSQDEQKQEVTSLQELFEKCRMRKTNKEGLRDSTSKSYVSGIRSMIEFIGADDATQITNRKINDWLEYLQFEKGLDPQTLNSRYLPAVRSTLKWAANQGYIAPIEITASVQVLRKPKDRHKGYTQEEANRILQLARDYELQSNSREYPETAASKRWCPWLAYFSGARIGEIAQLRKKDVRLSPEGIHYLHITPEAGTTKTGHYRDVPLHRQLVELGFLTFVENSTDGPLFFRDEEGNRDAVKAADQVAGQIAEWLRAAGLVPEGVSPNHGFRHGFKTLARRYGIATDYMHSIQGHATRTAGEAYGYTDLVAMRREISKIPPVVLADQS